MTKIPDFTKAPTTGGEIFQAMTKNKWRLESWNGEFEKIEIDEEILTLQAIRVAVVEYPDVTSVRFGLPADGTLSVVFEEDVGGRVCKAVELLKTLPIGELRLSVLDGDNSVLKTVVFKGVMVRQHYFDFDYASSETLKADLICVFREVKFE